MLDLLVEAPEGALELVPLDKEGLKAWLAGCDEVRRRWVEQSGFRAEPGSICLLPSPDGGVAAALAGLGAEDDIWAYAAFPARLPDTAAWKLPASLSARQAEQAATAWALAGYEFTRYKAGRSRPLARLVWPQAAPRPRVVAAVEAITLVRDLINTPASDMGPAELAAAAESLGGRFGAKCRVIVGDGLLAENYPAIHAVGRAAAQHRRPRLVDLRWGDERHPALTLVGKGVCFDTGGLDIKPSSNMKLMKKDMGGAAHVLGLASMIMALGLPVRLRVLIPAVENAVSGDAMRPLDVLSTRKGLTVEVGNTDAEGRLILCDALAEAASAGPGLIIDIATLTGAARSALGTDLPALFTNRDDLAADILRHGDSQGEPLWRLPLHKPYRRMIDSKVADLNNAPDSPHAGAITAALFLQEFVGAAIPWAHLDIMAWNASARPGRPEGGEALALRALLAMVEERFAT